MEEKKSLLGDLIHVGDNPFTGIRKEWNDLLPADPAGLIPGLVNGVSYTAWSSMIVCDGHSPKVFVCAHHSCHLLSDRENRATHLSTIGLERIGKQGDGKVDITEIDPRRAGRTIGLRL